MVRFAWSLVPLTLAVLLGGSPAWAQQGNATVADRPPVPADSVTGSRVDTVETDIAATDTTTADTTTADTAAANRRAQAKRAARAAAEEWLALVDGGDFEGSWAAADPTLRAGISRGDWADQGLRARHQLDTLRTRRLTQAQYRDSTAQLGGHPVVTLQYASEYAKGRAREAVITTKRDTAWAVAGYRVVSARGDSLQVRPDTTRTTPTP